MAPMNLKIHLLLFRALNQRSVFRARNSQPVCDHSSKHKPQKLKVEPFLSLNCVYKLTLYLTLMWRVRENCFKYNSHCRNCHCNPKMTLLTEPRWRIPSRGDSFTTRPLPSMEVPANIRKKNKGSC